MTGILLCAAGLPVCLTRAPKPILHPPPVSKSDVKPVPGVPGVCRKTKKKHLKKSTSSALHPDQTPELNPTKPLTANPQATQLQYDLRTCDPIRHKLRLHQTSSNL